MARLYDQIDDRMAAWIGEQPMFFVGTAPLAADGHVNVSPKGMAGTFCLLDQSRFAYLDLTGSGVETIAHLRENGRIVVMFCAFTGPPRIVRLHGRGDVVPKGDPGYAELAAHFPDMMSARSIIVVNVERIADSCGYGVPQMAYEHDRDQVHKWAANKGPEGIVEYQKTMNAESIDGLPGLSRA